MRRGGCPFPPNAQDEQPSGKTGYTTLGGDPSQELPGGYRTFARAALKILESGAEDNEQRSQLHKLVDRLFDDGEFATDDDEQPMLDDQPIDGAAHESITPEEAAAFVERVGIPGPTPRSCRRGRPLTKTEKDFREAAVCRADQAAPRHEGDVTESGHRRGKALKPITPSEANAFAARVLART